MVVAKIPRLSHAARDIALPLALLFAWDVGVTLLYLKAPAGLRPLELPLSLFGTAIALFLGIAVNASYARWWEARGLWGALGNASRSLARQILGDVLAVDPVDAADEPDGRSPADRASAGLPRTVVRAGIAHALIVRSTLRGEPPSADAAAYLPPALAASLDGMANPANAVLSAVGRLAAAAQRAGTLDGLARLRIETTLADLTNAQGGLERIRNTPLPVHFTVFPTLFAHLFCVLLPFAVVDDLRLFTPVGSTLVSLMFLMALQVGRDLMDPFADDVHAVPTAALCRGIEIDLCQALGEPAPPKMAPRDGVLW